jgi:hypothetical protein
VIYRGQEVASLRPASVRLLCQKERGVKLLLYWIRKMKKRLGKYMTLCCPDRYLSTSRYQFPVKRHKPEKKSTSQFRGLIPVGSVNPSNMPRIATTSRVFPEAAIEIGSDEVRNYSERTPF